MRRHTYWFGTLAVVTLALALRLGPLWWSPLPFNPDGIGYAARAGEAITTGHLPVAGQATDQFGYTALLAVVARATGHPPLTIAQPTSALVGAASCLVAVGLGRRVAAGAGLSTERSRAAGVLAGLLLAVDGLYVYRSMPTDEQTAGLLLVPLVAVAAWRALRTGRWAWRGIAVVLFLVLPPLHNHAGAVAAMMLTALLAIHVVDRPRPDTAVRALCVGGLAWLWALGYHPATAAISTAVVVQADRVTRVPGLFVAWILLVAVLAAWFVTTDRRLQRGTTLGIVAVLFAVLAVNAVRAVFPGTPTTHPVLLLTLGLLALPAAAGAVGVHRLTGQTTVGPAMLALVVGPLGLIGFSLTGGLTVEYLATLYRSQLYLHLPLAIAAGITTLVLARRVRDGEQHWTARAVRGGVPVVLVLCAAASVPVAFAGLELLTYKGVTTPAEFHATGHAVDAGEPWATDDHLARVGGYFVSGASRGNDRQAYGGARGPVRRWLIESGPPPDCAVLAQRSWTTTGAQFHPREPVRVESEALQRWLASRDVVYATGQVDPLVLVRGANAGECR